MALAHEQIRLSATNGTRDIFGPDWRALYRIGGFAAALGAVLTPLVLVVFAAWPPPYDEGARRWFELFEDDPILGLLSLDLGYIAINVLMIPVLIALFVALWRVSPSLMTLATLTFFVGLSAFLANNPSIEMLSLSNQYADATTEAQRIALIGAGEGLLASFEGTAFHLNYILAQLAGIAIGMVIIRSAIFSRKVGWLMVVGNAVGFGLYIPVVGLGLSAFAGVLLWVWMILLSFEFFKLTEA